MSLDGPSVGGIPVPEEPFLIDHMKQETHNDMRLLLYFSFMSLSSIDIPTANDLPCYFAVVFLCAVMSLCISI